AYVCIIDHRRGSRRTTPLPHTSLFRSQGGVRVSTQLRDAEGNVRLNSVVEPTDLLARTLDSGRAYGGLVQRLNRWYAMSIQPLEIGRAHVLIPVTCKIRLPSLAGK